MHKVKQKATPGVCPSEEEKKEKQDPMTSQATPSAQQAGSAPMTKEKQKSKTWPGLDIRQGTGDILLDNLGLLALGCGEVWSVAASEVHIANWLDSEAGAVRYQPCMRGGAGKKECIMHGRRRRRVWPKIRVSRV